MRTVRIFASSEVGLKAKLLFAALIALLCGLNALNVVNNYVGRNFMTAIADRQMAEFIRQAILYVAVFAALTVVGVFARFAEERLALLWREFLTRRIGRSKGGMTTKILALSDALGNLVRFELLPAIASTRSASSR